MVIVINSKVLIIAAVGVFLLFLAGTIGSVASLFYDQKCDETPVKHPSGHHRTLWVVGGVRG